jgi:hypothetical protein
MTLDFRSEYILNKTIELWQSFYLHYPPKHSFVLVCPPSLNDGCGNDCEVGKLCLDNKYGTIAIQMSKNASYVSIQDGVRCWLAIDRIERSYEATTILLLLLVTSTVGCMIEYFRYLPIPIYLALFVIAGFTLISWRYKW